MEVLGVPTSPHDGSQSYPIHLLLLACFLPPTVVLYSQAYLLVQPRQSPSIRLFRLSLVPFGIYSGLRTAYGYPFSSYSDGFMFLDFGKAVAGLYIVMKSLEWGLSKGPFRKVDIPYVGPEVQGGGKSASGEDVQRKVESDGRHNSGEPDLLLSPPIGSESKPPSLRLLPVEPFSDALDLVCDMQGIGWSFGPSRLPFQNPNLRTMSRALFVRNQTRTFLGGYLLYALAVLITYLSGPLATEDYRTEESIYTAFPFFPRYRPDSDVPLQVFCNFFWDQLSALLLTLALGIVTYGSISFGHALLSISSVTLLSPTNRASYPSSWPPLYVAPWTCDSLTGFWSQSWHGLFRRCFRFLAYDPIRTVAEWLGFGKEVQKLAGVMGVFVCSGVLHELGMLGMGQGIDPFRCTGFFVIQGVGVILEKSCNRWRKKENGGVWGRLWMWSWLLFWGPMVADAWYTRGIAVGNSWAIERGLEFLR